MKGMVKLRLFKSGTMALILPRLKDIANFVYTPLVKVNQANFFKGYIQLSLNKSRQVQHQHMIHFWNP